MFKPQLSTDTVELQEPIRFPLLASIKLDGIRGVTKYGSLLSRSMKLLPNEYIQDKLREYQDLDGEIIVGPWNAEDVRRKTSSGVRTLTGQPDFKFYVFDELSTNLPFDERLQVLAKRELPDFIVKLEQHLICNQAELETYYAKVLENGHEGLILRNPKSLYKHGRCTAVSQDSLKLKPFQDDEAVVTGFFEAMHNTNEAFTNELGRTARAQDQGGLVGNGMLGGFTATDIKTGKSIRVAAGKLSHAQRKHIFENQSLFVAKTLTYRHMPVGVKDAPNFARFIAWRDKFDM